MSNIMTLIGKQVFVKLSGRSTFTGLLTDIGQDILVLYNGLQYFYIPWLHVHKMKLSNNIDEFVDSPSVPSVAEELDSISYRKILTNAKGTFSEIYVTGELTFHGYITNVLSDYFVFYSPVYKTMMISMHHLKWLTPYSTSVNPYTLSNEALPVNPSNVPLLRSLEDQLKKAEGKLVVFDGGCDPMKIGLLKKAENSFIELAIASGETVYLKLSHIKSVHLP